MNSLLQYLCFIVDTNLSTLVKGNSFRSNRSIDSVNNSLIDDNAYNVKQKWMADNNEFSSGKSNNHLKFSALNSISDKNRFGQQPNNNSSYMGETTFSQSSMKRINSIAYGSDGLAFGCVPKEVIDQIEQSENDWATRNMAVEHIYDIIQETSSLKSIISYAPSFLKFLWSILNSDSNSKMTSNILKIINKILSNDQVNGQTLVTHLVKKLADSNIQIRQLAMRSLLCIMKQWKQTAYISMLLPYLGSTSWHIREEVLHLILVSFLSDKNDFDYYVVVDAIAKLLDDTKSTVRFTCRETLAALVVKGHKNRVCEILYEIVEKKEYNRLWDRFELGSWPKFFEDSLIFDFPIHSNEVLSRASSRGSQVSDSSKRSHHNVKSTRSRIGDSPLTSKEFDFPKNIISSNKDYGGLTVADSYKNGPTPSERMKKFNQSQVPMANHSSNNSMIHEYNISQSPGLNGEKPKDVTQNLRLLKNKIRLGSATSNESEPYVNNPRPSHSNRNTDIKVRRANNPMNSYEDQSDSIVSFIFKFIE